VLRRYVLSVVGVGSEQVASFERRLQHRADILKQPIFRFDCVSSITKSVRVLWGTCQWSTSLPAALSHIKPHNTVTSAYCFPRFSTSIEKSSAQCILRGGGAQQFLTTRHRTRSNPIRKCDDSAARDGGRAKIRQTRPRVTTAFFNYAHFHHTSEFSPPTQMFPSYWRRRDPWVDVSHQHHLYYAVMFSDSTHTLAAQT
jgi:hypothetical protein